MADETDLRALTPGRRPEVARALWALDDLAWAARARSGQRRRRLVVAAALTGAAVLAGWTVMLAMTLPRYYRAGGWRVTWIGFDLALLIVLAATAWAAWRRRQVLIGCLVVLATLLCCDAWFDTTLDWHTRGFTASLLLALTVELPVAAVCLIGARRLLRFTIGRLEHLEGSGGTVPPFWKVPLFGDSSVGYRHLLAPGRGAGPDPGPGSDQQRSGPGR